MRPVTVKTSSSDEEGACEFCFSSFGREDDEDDAAAAAWTAGPKGFDGASALGLGRAGQYCVSEAAADAASTRGAPRVLGVLLPRRRGSGIITTPRPLVHEAARRAAPGSAAAIPRMVY